MSYIHLISSPDALVRKEWIADPKKAYFSLEERDQCGYLLQHALFLNVLKSLYKVVPTLLEDYVKDMTDMIRRYIRFIDQDWTASTVSKNCCMYMDQLLQYPGVTNYEGLIYELDTHMSEAYPRILPKSFYAPYLEYFGKLQRGENMDVSVIGDVAVPTFSLRGRWLMVGGTHMTGYHMNDASKKAMELGPVPIPADSYFGFLLGFPWNSLNFSAFMGILGSYGFDLDRSACAQGSYEPIYAVVRSVLTCYKPAISPYVDSLSTSFDDTYYRRLFVSFVIALRKLHGLKIENASLLAEFLSKEKDEGMDDLTQYLSAVNAEGVSSEMQSAFRKSVFGQFDELDITYRANRLKKGNVSTGIAGSTASIDLSTSKETLDACYLQEVRITEPAPYQDKKSNTDESDDASTSGSDVALDDLPGGDELDATPDEGDAGATGDDDTSGTGSDGTDDPSVAENGNPGDPTNPNANGNGNPDTHIPDPADVSDKKGVKIELASSESTDTFIWRRELKAYLKKVVANPPKGLSVEKIEGLRNVLAYLINMLSPQSVYDVVNSLVKLPSEFKIHKHKKDKDKLE